MDAYCYHIDAFTKTTFSGNPAAVVLVPPSSSLACTTSILQSVAAEFNLSETAFVIPTTAATNQSSNAAHVFRDQSEFQLRWFTPKNEVALCGHATLASAHALFTHASNISESLTFHTLSGPLVVSRGTPPSKGSEEEGKETPTNALLRMKFPFNAPTPRTWSPQEDSVVFEIITKAFAGLPNNTSYEHLQQSIHSVHYNRTTKKLIIRLKRGKNNTHNDEEEDHNNDDSTSGIKLLQALTPDTIGMLHISQDSIDPTTRITGVSVTVKGDGSSSNSSSSSKNETPLGNRYDFYSRYFSPWNGISEDPVNGSSHTILGPYWTQELGKFIPAAPEKCNKEEVAIGAGGGGGEAEPQSSSSREGTVVARQASSRGGTLYVTSHEDMTNPANSWVELAGYAVTFASGKITVL